MFENFFINGVILLQSLDVSDITSLGGTRDLSIGGLLLVFIIMLGRRLAKAEERIETMIKEREVDNQKYVDLLISTTKIIDENTRMYQRLEKLLDK